MSVDEGIMELQDEKQKKSINSIVIHIMSFILCVFKTCI